METERKKITDIARTWLKTPYHSNAMIKGIGCDCLTILAGVFDEAGLVIKPPIPKYSPQFMLNRSDELYMSGLLEYTKEVSDPLPGDIAMWKFGRCFSHAGIVIRWPIIIHAYVGRTVQEEDVSKADWLNFMPNGKDPRPRKFFSYWGQE